MINEMLQEIFITEVGEILIETDASLYELHDSSFSLCKELAIYCSAKRALVESCRNTKILDIYFESGKRYLILMNAGTEIFGVELPTISHCFPTEIALKMAS